MIPRTRVKHDIVIGVDPDVEGSGVAILSDRRLTTCRKTLPELTEYFRTYSMWNSVVVVVEAGWMNPSNQHIKGNEKARYASKVGEKIGRCHEIARQIVEFCKFYKIPYVEKFPLKKIWQTSTGKIGHKQLLSLCKGSGVTYEFETKDQEQRDAALLALDYSEIPLIMAPLK